MQQSWRSIWCTLAEADGLLLLNPYITPVMQLILETASQDDCVAETRNSALMVFAALVKSNLVRWKVSTHSTSRSTACEAYLFRWGRGGERTCSQDCSCNCCWCSDLWILPRVRGVRAGNISFLIQLLFVLTHITYITHNFYRYAR